MNNISNGRRLMNVGFKGRKERDNEDELHLFRELHNRDNERTASLLLPVSDDFIQNNNGNSSFYRIRSIKKESGFEFSYESNKSDYDWLKTPPATPLFPSLEMEATAPHLKFQKEIPLVLQPQSQSQSQSLASSNSEATRRISGMAPKSATRERKIPSRSITPNPIPRMNSTTEPKNVTKRATTPSPNHKTNNYILTNNLKPKENNCIDFLSSKLSSSANNNTKQNPSQRTRTTSPLVTSTIASQISDFSKETPSNLKTDRSTSVTRGRQLHQAASVVQKPEPINPRRQSCSPNVTRGRRVVEAKKENRGVNLSTNDMKRNEMSNVLGSRMVEKVMNARKGNGNGNEERDAKPQPRNGINENSRVGGFVSTSRTLADKTSRQTTRKK